MPSSYSKFTIQDLNDLGIEVIEKTLFVSLNIPEKAPSDFLMATLERNQRRKLRSEKAKSEFIIAPILADLEEQNRGRFAFFSGYKFNVDAKKGLRGYCDYIFSAKPDAVVIEAPVFCVVEAKNDNLDNGIPQCIAELYAAHLFNKQKGKEQPAMYGAVTFGFEWKFIELAGQVAAVDTTTYYYTELPKVLGVLQYIINRVVV